METRRDFAYLRLRSCLQTGRFRPGDRMGEVALSRELKVSRGPLREAINQLASEGLLRRAPGLGAFVPQPSLPELVEGYEVRAALESFAAGRAAEKLSKTALERLHGIVEAMADLVATTAQVDRWEGTDREKLLGLDLEFHEILAAASGNRRLMKLLEDQSLLQSIVSYDDHGNSTSTHESRSEAVEEHRSILAALEARDSEVASRAMLQHIGTATRNAVAALNSMLGE